MNRLLPLLFCAVVWPSSVLAAGSVIGMVKFVRVDRGGQGMVVFDRQVSGTRPACVVPDYANAFAFDANTSGGKAIMAAALSAKASGVLLEAHGLGSCPTYGGLYIEDLSYSVVRDVQ